MDVRPCALIPVYNHAATLPAVVEAARRHLPVFVVDDGSTDGAAEWLKTRSDLRWTRHEINRGKGEALRTGFRLAQEAGFTHAITLDADGQHLPDQIPEFVRRCRERPEAVLVGVRDFRAAGAPKDRHWANRVSNFWFWAATGERLGDTQCGYRGYPLDLVTRLVTRVRRYGYELELLVRASWLDRPLVPVPVGVVYSEQTVKGSHFRPVVDCLRIAWLNARLVLQAFFVPRPLRALLSVGGLRGEPFGRKFRVAFRHVLGEHMQEPARVGLAIGLGVFCGFAPIWGGQMATAALLAHVLRVNKAVAVLSSNVSAPFMIPLVLYVSLGVGHWLLHGTWVSLWSSGLTSETILQRLLEYLVGAFAAGAAAGVLFGFAGWAVAALWRRGRRGSAS
jgi:uncharacterized protein (DUF2062 family)